MPWSWLQVTFATVAGRAWKHGKPIMFITLNLVCSWLLDGDCLAECKSGSWHKIGMLECICCAMNVGWLMFEL